VRAAETITTSVMPHPFASTASSFHAHGENLSDGSAIAAFHPVSIAKRASR